VSQDAKRGNLKQFFLKDFTQIEKKKVKFCTSGVKYRQGGI
jgi:hypothetical protein